MSQVTVAPSVAAETAKASRTEALKKAIPDLQDDIRKLKLIVPQLHSEISDVKRDMQLILCAVRGLQTQPQSEGAGTKNGHADAKCIDGEAHGKHAIDQKPSGTIGKTNSGVSGTAPPTSPSSPSGDTQGV